jgi:FAD/FMN-containing dehydrogenase
MTPDPDGQRERARPGDAFPESAAGPGRRGFLLMAGLALGAGSGAMTALAGCARPGHPGTPGPTPGGPAVSGSARPSATAAPVPASAQDWAALGRQLTAGELVRPGSPEYGIAKLLFDPRFDTSHPAGIAYCATPQDVSACVTFVREHGIAVAVRSGGHSYGGWSGSAGLVIDVSRLNEITFDQAAGTVLAGSGTMLVDFYGALAAHGRAVPGGSCPTVGIAGLALGGGVGVVGRLLGLTCDNLLAVQIVTADGAVRDVSPASDPDLFWACQGGGGGSFGVVTAFTFRTHPAPDLTLFYLTWPWSQAAAVISAWQSWAPSAPDELWSNLHLTAAPGGSEPSISVGGTYAGGSGELAALLGRLYAKAGAQPATAFSQAEPYLTVMLVEAGCASLTVEQCRLPSQGPAGVLGREPELAKSDFYTTAIPAEGISTLLSHVEQMQQVAAARGAVGAVAFDAFGGAINRVSPAATAFVHRDTLFLAQYSTGWRSDVPGAALASAPVQAQLAWLESLHAAMQPYASGQAYQNYADPDLADWQRAYYGANYPRLQAVKAAVDPGDMFRFPQSIELPAGTS